MREIGPRLVADASPIKTNFSFTIPTRRQKTRDDHVLYMQSTCRIFNRSTAFEQTVRNFWIGLHLVLILCCPTSFSCKVLKLCFATRHQNLETKRYSSCLCMLLSFTQEQFTSGYR